MVQNAPTNDNTNSCLFIWYLTPNIHLTAARIWLGKNSWNILLQVCTLQIITNTYLISKMQCCRSCRVCVIMNKIYYMWVKPYCKDHLHMDYSTSQELYSWFVFCFVLLWYRLILSIFFRIALLALGQSYNCPSASEATLKNMDK